MRAGKGALGLSLAAASVILIMVISAWGEGARQEESAFYPDFDFAVGISSDRIDESVISYYDAEEGLLCRQRMEYGNLSDMFKPGVVKNNVVYLSPEGKSPEREEHCVLAVDLNSGKPQVYQFGEKETRMLSLSVNERNIYVCSNLNGTSTVSRCAIDSGKVRSVNIQGCIIDYLYAGESVVYAFGSGLEDEEYALYELEADSLSIRSRIRLQTRSGISGARLYGDNLYFSVSADLENYPESKTQLGCYSSRTKKVKWADFSEQEAAGDIEECGGRLLIAHTELPYGTGHDVTVFDPESGSKRTVSFDEEITQMRSRGNSLYILSCGQEGDTGTVTEYRYGKKGFEKIGSVRIETEKGKEDFYIGSFWLKGE